MYWYYRLQTAARHTVITLSWYKTSCCLHLEIQNIFHRECYLVSYQVSATNRTKDITGKRVHTVICNITVWIQNQEEQQRRAVQGAEWRGRDGELPITTTTTRTHTFPSRTHTNQAPSETVLSVQTALWRAHSSWKDSGSCVSWAYT